MKYSKKFFFRHCEEPLGDKAIQPFYAWIATLPLVARDDEFLGVFQC